MASLLDSLTGVMTMLIPVVAIIGGISFAAYSMYLKVRRQRETLQMYHLERMAAIEKGIELPPLPPELLHDRYYDAARYRGEYRRWRRGRGIILILVGAAVTVAMWQSDGDNSFWWGLVIVAWGLGRLISDYLEVPGAGAPPQSGSGGPSAPDSQ